MSTTAASAPAKKNPELTLFKAICDRCGRNPLAWSMQTRRLYRKRIQKCRKCTPKGGVQ